MATSNSLLQVLFRVSVVIGCVSMLLGVAGVFYFSGRAPREPARRMLDHHAAVILDIPASTDDLEVVVRWTAKDGSLGEERGRRGSDAITWLFERTPQAAPVDLLVYRTRAGRREELHRTQAVLQRGGHYQVALPR